jgi:hypothetical protein
VAPREEDNNKGFTFDKKNPGSVNPLSHSDSGVNTPRTEFDKCKQKIYENPLLSPSPLPPDPNTYNKIRVNTNTTQTPGTRNPEPGEMSSPGNRNPEPEIGIGGSEEGEADGGQEEERRSGSGSGTPPLSPTPESELRGVQDIQRLLGARRRGSRVVGVRLGEELYAFLLRKAREAHVESVSSYIRYRLIADYLAEHHVGVDSNTTLDLNRELKPNVVIPVNLNVVNNNNNVNVGFRKYVRELQEPHLKAELRNLAGEVLNGPPKEKKWDPICFDDVWVTPSPEKVAKWIAEKSDALIALLKRMDKLRVQLTPEEEELLKQVKEKLGSMSG